MDIHPPPSSSFILFSLLFILSPLSFIIFFCSPFIIHHSFSPLYYSSFICSHPYHSSFILLPLSFIIHPSSPPFIIHHSFSSLYYSSFICPPPLSFIIHLLPPFIIHHSSLRQILRISFLNSRAPLLCKYKGWIFSIFLKNWVMKKKCWIFIFWPWSLGLRGGGPLGYKSMQ